jgi:putative ABC transport system permease protein
MGFIVGVIVVYQILFTDVTDHLTEYATLKAIGYADRQLLLVVFQEAIILAVLGFIPGFGCSLWIYGILGDLTKIPLVMRTDVVIKVFALTISMCLISAAIAMRKLQAADPADIFR